MKRSHIWIFVVGFYIMFIFSNSIKVAEVSSGDSGKMLQLIHSFLNSLDINAIWLTEHVLRKMGHFTEYSLLGVLLYGCMRSIGMEKEKQWLIHVTIGYAVPFIDETIQLFVEGRSGQISDVWLDGAGIAFGTLIAVGIFFICKRTERIYVKKLSNTPGI